MKKKIVVIIMAIFLFFCGDFIIVSADSGWDYSYDYDYGSDWSSSDWSSSDWSSSDWDYDIDYSGNRHTPGSSSGSFEWEGLIFVFVVFLIIFSPMIIFDLTTRKKHKDTNRLNSYIYSDIPNIISHDNFDQYPEFNREAFLEQAYNIYVGVQTAWSEFDYDMLSKLTTDEMYNMYRMQLEALNIKNEKNIMENFNKTFIGITDISEVNNILTVKVRLNVSQKDYVINSTTGQITRGDADISCNIAYDLTFVNDVKKEILNNCPNCGAPINNINSQKCEYCNADLVGNSADNWVLAKKEVIKQWR